jgi:hypothetical protein
MIITPKYQENVTHFYAHLSSQMAESHRNHQQVCKNFPEFCAWGVNCGTFLFMRLPWGSIQGNYIINSAKFWVKSPLVGSIEAFTAKRELLFPVFFTIFHYHT